MSKYFVIQPFDRGKFDKRYRDTFKPAIEEAGLEAYRVDEDPAVEVPIDEIERGIRDSTICLADITTDNPNVWYELGFAFALSKKVLLVCSDEREGAYPFDIQHRNVTKYAADSAGDFHQLQQDITKRAKSLLERKEQEERTQIRKGQQEGRLSDIEVQVLRLAADANPLPGRSMSIEEFHEIVASCSMTGVGVGLAIRGLQEKEFVAVFTELGEQDEMREAISLTEEGWHWMRENSQLFSIEEH